MKARLSRPSRRPKPCERTTRILPATKSRKSALGAVNSPLSLPNQNETGAVVEHVADVIREQAVALRERRELAVGITD